MLRGNVVKSLGSGIGICLELQSYLTNTMQHCLHCLGVQYSHGHSILYSREIEIESICQMSVAGVDCCCKPAVQLETLKKSPSCTIEQQK